MSAATRCPYGEKYAHSIFDLVPPRPWDPESTAKATQPCPLGYACPEYEKPVTTYFSTTTVPTPAFFCNGCQCYHAGPRCPSSGATFR